MAKAFSIRDFMNDARQQDSESDVFEKVSIYDIGTNPKNEYAISEIEKIKDSIYALGGVQQNIVLVRCPERAAHKYLALDGHRRLSASRELVEEGYNEFEFVPAVIKGQIDTDMEAAMLVLMNSTQRNKTDWEKVMEHMRLKEIIPKLKKRQGIDGRARDIEADMLGVSRGQISIYNTIGTRLNAELMKLFETERIGISLAYEAAKLEPGLQERLVELAHDSGSICDEDVKQLAGSRPISGQQTIAGISEENVPESGTFVEAQNEPVCAELTEKSEICYTNNAEEIGTAIDFIFFMNDFPEDKLNRLMDAFRRKENFTNASIAAELIFKEMLPYESRCIKVAYHAGYQVEYIQTGEIYCFPPYDFWKGFESGAGFCLDRNDIEQPEKAIENENVSDHDISEPDKLKVDKLPDISFRGGYTLAMVDKQIEKYGRYLSMAVEAGDIPNLVSEYSCLLDALELLRIGITMEDDDYEEGS